jgi:putative flippase GtrA
MTAVMTRQRLPPALVGQLTRFAVVGATNTILTLVSYALLVAAGAPAVAAAVASWTLGAANGYRLNRAWTFASAARGASPALRYCGVQAVGAGVDAAAVWALVAQAHAPRLAGAAAALPLATALTFALCRQWVFAGERPA